MWLPVAADEPARSVSEPAAKAPHGVGIVLIVDDEELVRASTSAMLADLGYSVREAGSAEEALRLMDEGLQPDLVVTDHLMPGMSGADLARELRGRRSDLKVLIVSGFADMDSIAPDLAMLRKPFRAADLIRALRSQGYDSGP